MPVLSAGILLYRRRSGTLEVLLVHPGGPYWAARDEGAWMIPKGVVEPGEAPSACALREFEEELGTRPSGIPQPLARIRQKGGKWVEAFAMEGDLDAEAIASNSFEMEWPPTSGQMKSFPEVDRAGWFTLDEARGKMLRSQLPLLDALEAVEV
jgi:predicted NUDIX family NTP pyrophosphohydrolase